MLINIQIENKVFLNVMSSFYDEYIFHENKLDEYKIKASEEAEKYGDSDAYKIWQKAIKNQEFLVRKSLNLIKGMYESIRIDHTVKNI